MKLIIKKTSILLLIALFAICTLMGIINVNFSAQAAATPEVTHIALTDNLGGKGLVKGKSVAVTLTITIDPVAELEDKFCNSYDLSLTALTENGEINTAVLPYISAKPVSGSDVVGTSLDMTTDGYMDVGSGDYLREDGENGQRLRIAFAYQESSETTGRVYYNQTVTFNVEIVVDANIPVDTLIFGVYKESVNNQIIYTSDDYSVRVTHATLPARKITGLIGANDLVIPLKDETEDNSLESLEIGPAADALTEVDMTVEKPTYAVVTPMDQMVVKPVAGAPELATVQVGVTDSEGTLVGAPVGLTADGTVTLSPRPSHGQKIKITVTSQVGVAADYFVDIVISYARLVALTSDVAPVDGTTLGFQEAIGSDGLATLFAYTLHVPTVQDVQLTPTVLAGYEINETVAVAVTGGTAAATVTNGNAATVTMTDATTVVTLTLTAADGTTTQDYTITILSTDVSITTFTLTGDSGTVYNNSEDQATGNSVDYFFSVDKETTVQGKMTIVAATGATVQVEGSDYDAATVYAKGEYSVTVTAVAGNFKVYKVKISAPEYLELTLESEYQFLVELVDGRWSYRVAYDEMPEWDEERLIHGVNDAHLSSSFVLGQIKPQTKIAQFVTNIKQSLLPYVRIFLEDEYGLACVYDRGVIDDEFLTESVATGWWIEFGSGETPSEIIRLSVLGDLTGDGLVNASDTTPIQRIIQNKDSISKYGIEYRLAGYLSNSGSIMTAGDFSILKSIISNKMTTADLFWYPEETYSMASAVSNAPAFAVAPMMILDEEMEEVLEIEVATESRLAVNTQEPIEDAAEPTESEEPVKHQPVVPSKKFGYTDWDVKEKTND